MTVPYEFYASQSGLVPSGVHTQWGHQTRYYYNQTRLEPLTDIPTFVDLAEAATLFYTQKSGLTPVESYTIEQHIAAYYDNTTFTYSSWRDQLEADALAIFDAVPVPGSNLFTATFESNF